MAQATAQIDSTMTVQPVATSSLSMSFERCIVTLTRPWWPEMLMLLKNWYVPGYARAAFSNGKGKGDAGLLPVVATGFVAIRNLTIAAKWSDDDLDAMQKSASFGSFSLIGRTYDAATNTLTSPGMQIIGWFCEALPVLPPVSDPAMAGSQPPSSTRAQSKSKKGTSRAAKHATNS
jgi:hypothetical protein